MAIMQEQIPRSLAQFFQEYSFEQIDPERDGDLVIERTLAWGNRDELRWLFARYGRRQIADWIRRMGTRRLPKQHLPFWLLVLDIPLTELVQSPRGVWQY